MTEATLTEDGRLERLRERPCGRLQKHLPTPALDPAKQARDPLFSGLTAPQPFCQQSLSSGRHPAGARGPACRGCRWSGHGALRARLPQRGRSAGGWARGGGRPGLGASSRPLGHRALGRNPESKKLNTKPWLLGLSEKDRLPLMLDVA